MEDALPVLLHMCAVDQFSRHHIIWFPVKEGDITDAAVSLYGPDGNDLIVVTCICTLFAEKESLKSHLVTGMDQHIYIVPDTTYSEMRIFVL